MAVTNEAISEQIGEDPDVLNIDQLATKLNVPKSWIYRQCRLRKRTGFPVEKYGKYLRFDYQRVRKWAAENDD